MGDGDASLEMMRAMQEDLRTMRDNHLFHIEKDMRETREQVVQIDARLQSVESFVEEIKTLLKKYAWYIVGLVCASVGAPMMM